MIFTKMDLNSFEKKVFSQNGEDGITEKLIEIIYQGDNENKCFVEFGVQDGKECNTRILREKYNWNGLQMDGSFENHSINLKKHWICKENINNLFELYSVPKTINLLSVDIDFNDFYVLKEILFKYKCDIIICEYNATHLPHEDKIVVYNKYGMWDSTNYFGASLFSLYKLSRMFNYSIVCCDNMGVNCFMVHNDIIKKHNLQFNTDIYKIYKSPKYSIGPNRGHPQDPTFRKYLSFENAMNIK